MDEKANREKTDGGWRWDHSYARLPGDFFTRQNPEPAGRPRTVVFNTALAEDLGLDAAVLGRPDAAGYFAGNRLPEGAQPIAQAYSGHQYGHFTTLGDGRAILLGEHLTPAGDRFDIQLKGSGRTPYSRGGDGRAALGSMLREYLISEAMHFLGIPTTRSLAVVTTGEKILRQEVLPGAVLTRVAASHIRVGTFQHFAARGAPESIRILMQYTLQRHYPDLAGSENPALALLQGVAERQAELLARWYAVGFIHGVMNTDNMALSGETIDYGPCAFMNAYNPSTVYSSIDRHGRYAYGNQARIGQWNLARFAETLLPWIDAQQAAAVEHAEELLKTFGALFQHHWLTRMRAKLGLFGEEEGDEKLISSLLDWMHGNEADFTNTFRDLTEDPLLDQPLYQQENFRTWIETWQHRLARQPQTQEEARRKMEAHNPAVIPRNHRVEEALEAAEKEGDFSKFERLHRALSRPYAADPEFEDYRQPPAKGEDIRATFCGT
jgi:serine/tyrosine/threonine adenylyltransferase